MRSRLREIRRGSGAGRRSLVVWSAVGVVLGGVSAAHGQLEVLLRGLEPAPPRAGAAGRYRFTAEEPSGPRTVVFDAVIERVDPDPNGSVVLRLTSGDSLEATIELAPEMFAGKGGSLLDHVRSVVETTNGKTRRLEPEDWNTLPGLDRAPALPGARDSLLGSRDIRVGSRELHCAGRHVVEESRQVKPLGNVQMTQSVRRDIETWTAPEAPILGIVHATAAIESERRLSQPVPGVPQQGPRHWHYEIQLESVETPPAPPRR